MLFWDFRQIFLASYDGGFYRHHFLGKATENAALENSHSAHSFLDSHMQKSASQLIGCFDNMWGWGRSGREVGIELEAAITLAISLENFLLCR